MVNLSDAVSLLQAKRKELSDQLDAVDKALAALNGPAASEVLPTRLRPARALSDEHRHALKEGRRKARHSKDAAAGRAREILDPRPGLAPASSADGRRPRLVKQSRA
jgi:hypothetical protein